VDAELLKALLPWGGVGFGVVMVYLFTAQILKTWRTRMVTKQKDSEDTEV